MDASAMSIPAATRFEGDEHGTSLSPLPLQREEMGGAVADYQPIHDWFDASKAIIADFRHRALRHHAEGIFMAETIFGIRCNSPPAGLFQHDGGEQHVREDLGFIPSFADWMKPYAPSRGWAARNGSKTSLPCS